MIIDKNILEQISSAFQSVPIEQGFLLGSSNHSAHISHCIKLTEINSGMNFYEPNPKAANFAIHNWFKQGICFTGFIHSHITPKMDLSEDDIHFAEKLFSSFRLPTLWFGIGTLCNKEVIFHFYSVQKTNGIITLEPEKITIQK